jgi:hypothetical protein
MAQKQMHDYSKLTLNRKCSQELTYENFEDEINKKIENEQAQSELLSILARNCNKCTINVIQKEEMQFVNNKIIKAQPVRTKKPFVYNFCNYNVDSTD